MKKKYLVIVLLFLVANTCYIYHQHVGLKKVHSFLSELRQDTGERLGILEMQKEDRMYEIQFNGQLIDKELTVIDTDGKQKKIGDLIIDNKLFACAKAIELTIKSLSSWYNDKNKSLLLPQIIDLEQHTYE